MVIMASVVRGSVLKNKQLLWNISQEIWKHPELSFKEVFAHDLLTSTLEDSGFSVQKQYLLPTAFRAEFDSQKDGPTIAVLCEYDALPGIGHACGHNLIAEMAMGVGIAVKEAMEAESTIQGKLVVLGTPAEEDGGGKIELIRKGAFKDIDAAMMAHPQSVNRLYPLIVESAEINVTFKTNPGKDPWDGPSAVDAAVACYNNIALIRRTLKEKWRINVIIPTSSHEESKMEFIYRAPSQGDMYILKEQLEACIETAAQVSNCTYETNAIKDMSSAYRGLLYNNTMTEVFGKYARSMGVTFYDNDPKFTESAVSSDVGNVSQVLPAMQPEFFIGAVNPNVNHTPGFAQVANSEEAQAYTLVFMEALANTVVDLMSNPDLMSKVADEFINNPLKDPGSYKRKLGEI